MADIQDAVCQQLGTSGAEHVAVAASTARGILLSFGRGVHGELGVLEATGPNVLHARVGNEVRFQDEQKQKPLPNALRLVGSDLSDSNHVSPVGAGH